MSMTSLEPSNKTRPSIPNFSLPSTHGKFSMQDLIGSPSIIVFYPKDHSSVCSNQLSVYNEAIRVFRRYDADLVAISVDDMQSHERFSDDLNIKFPLLSDSNPKGEVSRAFDVYDEEMELSKRAIFVTNSDGEIIWSQIYPISINPGAEGILKALDHLDNN